MVGTICPGCTLIVVLLLGVYSINQAPALQKCGFGGSKISGRVGICVKVGATAMESGWGTRGGFWARESVVRDWVGEWCGVDVELGSWETGVGLYGEKGV